MPFRLRGLLHTEARRYLDAVYASHAVIEFRLDGAIETANGLFLSAMGYTLDEIRGQHHAMFLEPGAAETIDYRQFWDALRAGQHQTAEFRRIGKGGREVWIQASYCPVLGRDGRPRRIVKFATIVTARTLQAAFHAGQVAAINRSQAVIVFGLDGIVLDVNDNFLRVLGYAREEVVGRHHRMFVDPAEVGTAAYATFWTTLAAGQYQAAEYRRIGKGGREVWIQASYNPILDPAGRPVKVVKYATDITAQVQDRLRRAALGRDVDLELSSVAGAVTQTSAAAHGAVEAARESLTNVHAVAAAADQLAVSVGEITRQVAEAKQATSGARDEAERASGLVAELVSAADQIEHVVGMISSIAAQTNLLALNATIEAARAGEVGKGFAVVASEVKGLASETARATEDITTQVGQVQGAVQNAVRAIGSIAEAVGAMDGITAAIAAAVEEQSVVTRDVSLNMQIAAEAVDRVSDDLVTIATAATGAEAKTRTIVEMSRALAA